MIRFTEQSKKNLIQTHEDQGLTVTFKDTIYSEIAVVTDKQGKKIVTWRAGKPKTK